MLKRRHWETIYKSILLVVVFLLASEPVLVAAQPPQVDPRQEAIDTLTASGDVYLTNVVEALSLSTGLANSVKAIQSTPLTQLSENAVSQTRASALKAAETSAIALGSIDDLATSIEFFGSNLPVAFDPFQRTAEGLPQQLRDDLIQEAGLSSADVDAISTGMDDILLARQDMVTNGMPAGTVAQLSQAGFSQTEIDQLAQVAGTRGLADTTLATSLAQFRASQDEWADVRTQMLILNIQLLGYQIGSRQANGIEPRAVTEAELQEIAEDELRLLVHVAHLQALWGSDPNLNIGEGDWWFIEHYAGRAAERLEALIIETQNRGLAQDLFVLQEMRLLALTAKHGDANYVKAELDGLGGLLSFLVGDATFISKQRDELKGLSYLTARLISHPKLRARMQWPIAAETKTYTAKNASLRMETVGIENLAPLSGVIVEQNESNNTKTLVFIAGLSFIDQSTTWLLNEILTLSVDLHQMGLAGLLTAVLNGETSNPLLIGTNILLGMIPVVNVMTDVFSLLTLPGTLMKALMLFALICDIGETLAWLPTLQVAGVTYVAGAITEVIESLFKNADTLFKAILNGLQLADAFNLVVQLVKVVGTYITSAVHSVGEAFQVLWDLFTGNLKFWDNFVAFVKRVGAETLLKLGFDEGSLLVGRILNLGVDMSDEALLALKNVTDDLLAAGVELSDEAAEGLGKLAKSMEPEEFERLVNALNTCGMGMIHHAPMHARIKQSTLASSPCTSLTSIFTSYKNFDNATLDALSTLSKRTDFNSFTNLLKKFAANPDDLEHAQFIFKVLGNSDISAKAVRMATEKGPEAAEAFALWAKDFPNGKILANGKPILENNNIAEALALRAKNDEKAIKILREWNGVIDDLDIEGLALYSTVGNNRLFGLGPGPKNKLIDSPYSDGWVQFSINRNANFYITNPEVSDLITKLIPDEAQRDAVFWSINKAALIREGGPIATRSNFVYQIASNNIDDVQAIEKIWNKASDAEINIALGRKADDPLPYRMKELKTIFNNGANGYQFQIEADNNIFIYFKP